MKRDQLSEFDRRRFLMMTGALGGSALLAGCGGVNTTNTGPGDTGGGNTGTKQQGGTKPKKGGTFIGTTPENAPTLDPRMNELAWYNSFAFYLFDTLFLTNPDGSEFVPHLAAEKPHQKDDTTFVITLRDDVTFHDGTELTAEDVVYSISWILNPKNKSPNRSVLTFIDTVEVADTYRVRFNLEYPFALFEAALASMNAPIVPKRTAEKMGQKKFAQHPIGSGPFKLEEFQSASHITLTRFDDYFLKTPYLAGVKWRVIPKHQVQFVELATGGIHTASIPKTLLGKAKKDPDIEMAFDPQLDYNGLIFNATNEPFRKLEVRKAMQYLIDYEEMLKATKGRLGHRIYGFVPQQINKAWDFPWKEWKKKYYPSQDHDKAKQLLAEAGYGGGLDKTLKISSLASAEFKDMAIILQNELKKVGIDASVQEATSGQWLNQLESGNYDVTIYGWNANIPDPNEFYYYLFRDLRNDKGFSQNDLKDWTGDASAGRLYKLAAETGKHKEILAESDRKIRKARRIQDREKRRQLYIEIADIWQGLYPHIPVYYETSAVGWSKSVQDYDPTGLDPQPLCNKWYNAWLKNE